MELKYLSCLTTLTVFTAFFSIILHAYLASNDLNKLVTILTGLVALEHVNQTSTSSSTNTIDKPKIAIGFGSCSDVFVRAVTFLNYTDIDGGPSSAASAASAAAHDEKSFSVDDITNEEELLQSFGHYFRMGAAAERYTSDRELFKKLISITKSRRSIDDEPRWELGGNAPVMGIRFLKEGADVLLAATMSNNLRSFLPKTMRITGNPNDEDDIHLIMEYKTDEMWGPFKAPRANRYILHSDQQNPIIKSLELFEQSLIEFNPRLLVVSGLQMMDSYPFEKGVREDRLQKLQKLLTTQRATSRPLIHFEMASYVEIQLLRQLMKNVIPYSDSLGMNEQELDNLEQVLTKNKISFVSESNPRVATSLHKMRTIFKVLNGKYYSPRKHTTGTTADGSNRRLLSRIHVHTLAYQAILIVRNSEWKNTKNAAAKASLTAHRHVCGTQMVNPEASNLILDDSFSTTLNDDNFITNAPKRIHLKATDPVPCWNESLTITKSNVLDIEICVAPVLVCKVAKQTAGAGDNISAAGLILQI